MDGGGEVITDTFQYWRDALDAVRNNTPLPMMRDGFPQCGYFRTRKIKDGPWIPIASFLEKDKRIILINGYPVLPEDHNKTWLNCARHPVSYEDYEFCIANGNWPGAMAQPKAAEIGDNSAELVAETADIILIRELDAAKAWIETTEIDSDALADEAANRIGELRRLKGLVAKIHEVEKEPHLSAGRAVDDKYLPLIRDDEKKPGRATAAIKFLLGKITLWDLKKKAAADKIIADEQAAAHLKAMEEAAKASAQKSIAGQGGATTSDGLPVTPPVVPAPPPPAAPVRSSYGGVTGRKVASTVKKVAVIVDQEACYQHFKDNPQVKAVLQTLANAMVKAKMAVPGVEERDETGAI